MMRLIEVSVARAGHQKLDSTATTVFTRDERVEHYDRWIAGKVRSIKGQNVFEPVHEHCSDYSCIMSLLSGYSMGDNKPPPLRVNIVRLRQPENRTFHPS